MIDLHCHLLPGVDDGVPDLEHALALAERLVAAGFTHVAPSPHFGGGPGGDVWPARASEVRSELQAAFDAHGIKLKLEPNAEHHVCPALFERLAEPHSMTAVGGRGRWLLTELPWEQLPQPETILFRLQAKGWKLLLAHPERYSYLEVDACAREPGGPTHFSQPVLEIDCI